MEDIFVFLRAALPCIAVGLAIAVLFSKGIGNKSKTEQSDNYGTEGMCLGMCLGTTIGTYFGNNGIGISLGTLIGLTIGTCIKKSSRDKHDEEKE